MTMLRAFFDAALELDPGAPDEARNDAVFAPARALHALWQAVGLREVTTGELVVTADYADFDDFWSAIPVRPWPVRGLRRIARRRSSVAALRRPLPSPRLAVWAVHPQRPGLVRSGPRLTVRRRRPRRSSAGSVRGCRGGLRTAPPRRRTTDETVPGAADMLGADADRRRPCASIPYGRSWDSDVIVDGIEALPGTDLGGASSCSSSCARRSVTESSPAPGRSAARVAFPSGIDLQQAFWGEIIPFALVLFHFRRPHGALRPSAPRSRSPSAAEIGIAIALRADGRRRAGRSRRCHPPHQRSTTPADPVPRAGRAAAHRCTALRYARRGCVFGSGCVCVLVYHSLRQIRLRRPRLARRRATSDRSSTRCRSTRFARLTARTGDHPVHLRRAHRSPRRRSSDGVRDATVCGLMPNILIAVAVCRARDATRLVARCTAAAQFAAEGGSRPSSDTPGTARHRQAWSRRRALAACPGRAAKLPTGRGRRAATRLAVIVTLICCPSRSPWRAFACAWHRRRSA